MIFKLVLVCALLALPALGSSVKGYVAREETKGGRAQLTPIEQIKLHRDEQTTSLEQQQKIEEVPQRKLEEVQHLEPSKTRIEQPTKGVQRIEQQHEERVEQAPVVEQQKFEDLPQQKIEEVRHEETKTQRHEAKPQISRLESTKGAPRLEQREETLEQQPLVQQQHEYDAQLTETREEQVQISQVEDTRDLTQQQVYATKGAAPVVAPVGEAEPYAFSYQVEGSSRSESGDTRGTVRGHYTLQGSDGSSRLVEYIADHNGFRATVNTNEIGTENRSPAGVALRSSQPEAQDITLRLEGKTREDLLPPKAPLSAPVAPVPSKPENWSYKGAQAPVQLEETKGLKKIIETPAKGQRIIEEPQQIELAQVKSEPARSPKSIGELKLLPTQHRSFESATSHRVYRAQPVQIPRAAPAVLVRSQPATYVRNSAPAAPRAYLQRERYPQSPRAIYRQQVGVVNPRVSFYGPASGYASEEDQPTGFEHSE